MDAITGGDRFVSRGFAAWHKLGHVVPRERVMTAREAFKVAKLDGIRFEKFPLEFNAEGRRLIVPDRVALVRVGGGLKTTYVNTVHAKYPVLQNTDFANMLEAFSREWPVETAGALHDGEVLFVTMAAGKLVINGEDEIEDYALFNLNRTAKDPDIMGYVGTRVVCANTLQVALSGIQDRIKIRHTHGTYKVNVEEAIKMMASFRNIATEAHAIMEGFAHTPVGDKTRRDLVEMVYTIPDRPTKDALLANALSAGLDVSERLDKFEDEMAAWQRTKERVELTRSDWEALYQALSGEFADVKAEATAWHVYNTFTQFAQTYKPKYSRDIYESAMFGERAEQTKLVFQALAARSTPVEPAAVTSVLVPSMPAAIPTRQAVPISAAQPAESNGPSVWNDTDPGTPVKPATDYRRAIYTPEDKAANARAYVLDKARGQRFQDGDIQADPLLRRAAESYLRGTEINGNPFMADVKKALLDGRKLSDAQVRGVVNTIYHNAKS